MLADALHVGLPTANNLFPSPSSVAHPQRQELYLRKLCLNGNYSKIRVHVHPVPQLGSLTLTLIGDIKDVAYKWIFNILLHALKCSYLTICPNYHLKTKSSPVSREGSGWYLSLTYIHTPPTQATCFCGNEKNPIIHSLSKTMGCMSSSYRCHRA